jgi:hypothetical protein
MQVIYAFFVALLLLLPAKAFRVLGSLVLLGIIFSILTGQPLWFRIN